MSKKPKWLIAAEEARNEEARENLRLILRHGDAKTRQAAKKLITDAVQQVKGNENEAHRAIIEKLYNETFTWLPSDKQLKAAIAKTIKAVTKNIELLEAMPFEFGFGGDPSNVLKLQDDVGPYEFAEMIDPAIKRGKERAHKLSEKISPLVPADLSLYYSEMIDDFDHARMNAAEAGYYVGVIMGAKITGASEQQLEKLGRNLFIAITAQPRFGFTARRAGGNGKGGHKK
jgi:hypothetical protein